MLEGEKERLKGENEAVIAKEVVGIQKEKKELNLANALAHKRFQESQDKNETMNVKFQQVFGVFMDEWDRTRKGALKLLEDNPE